MIQFPHAFAMGLLAFIGCICFETGIFILIRVLWKDRNGKWETKNTKSVRKNIS